MNHKITYIYPILIIFIIVGVLAFLQKKDIIDLYEIFPGLNESMSQSEFLDISDEEGLQQSAYHIDESILKSFSLSDIPAYTNEAYYVVNNNEPYFSESDITEYTYTGYENYSQLDSLGRCGTTVAFIGRETMPKESRGDISSVKPSGWRNQKYDFVDGGWVYNRCHLIGWQLTAENDNECNLITGTRYMNVDGMLPFENLVADYVKETKGHVYYRVTPIFDGANLVADGVLMEAYSYEDQGEGVQFCVFCYNVQPGVTIDYKTGNNWRTK